MDIHRNALASTPPLCGMADGCQQSIVESRSANVMQNLCGFTVFLAKIAYRLRYFCAILMVGRPERKPRLISAFSPSKPKPDSMSSPAQVYFHPSLGQSQARFQPKLGQACFRFNLRTKPSPNFSLATSNARFHSHSGQVQARLHPHSSQAQARLHPH